jgi:hypothetical protein
VQTTHPDKQLVRDVMQQHRAERTPPMSLEEIRRHLGWFLVPGNREVVAK